MLSHPVVLIVDDQYAGRDSLEVIAKPAAAVEISAARSFAPVTVWIKAATRIDLLLTITQLPDDISGTEVARVAIAAQPDCAIVLISTKPIATVGDLPPRYALIQKPFDVSDLADHVDRAFLQSNSMSGVRF